MPVYAARLRDVKVIDGELRLVSRAWWAARQLTASTPNTALLDALLDERAAAAQTAVAGELADQPAHDVGDSLEAAAFQVAVHVDGGLDGFVAEVGLDDGQWDAGGDEP